MLTQPFRVDTVVITEDDNILRKINFPKVT